MSETTQLVRYDAMCRAIAEAHAIDEVKDIRDRMLAIQSYARMAQNTEAEEKAREIRLRAERKCGQMLAGREMATGGQPYRSDRPTGSDHPKPLADLGISKQQSSDWQKLAAVPSELFEQALAEPNPSTAGIITRHEVATRGPVPAMDNHKALFVWGRLLDFEREGILDEDPAELFDMMLDHMKQTTSELAPRVVAWLWGICDAAERGKRRVS